MHQLYLFLLFLVLVHSPSRCEQAVGDFCQTDGPREKQFSFAPAFYRHVEDLCLSTTTIINPCYSGGGKTFTKTHSEEGVVSSKKQSHICNR